MDSPEIIATTPTSEFITSFSDVSSSVSALSEENNEVTVSTQEYTSETSAETLAAETLISEVISESETAAYMRRRNIGSGHTHRNIRK